MHTRYYLKRGGDPLGISLEIGGDISYINCVNDCPFAVMQGSIGINKYHSDGFGVRILCVLSGSRPVLLNKDFVPDTVFIGNATLVFPVVISFKGLFF